VSAQNISTNEQNLPVAIKLAKRTRQGTTIINIHELR